MPKVILTASQREEEKNAYRQREFVRILLEMKIDGISQNSIAYEWASALRRSATGRRTPARCHSMRFVGSSKSPI